MSIFGASPRFFMSEYRENARLDRPSRAQSDKRRFHIDMDEPSGFGSWKSGESYNASKGTRSPFASSEENDETGGRDCMLVLAFADDVVVELEKRRTVHNDVKGRFHSEQLSIDRLCIIFLQYAICQVVNV
jgi:hypothetical protein